MLYLIIEANKFIQADGKTLILLSQPILFLILISIKTRSDNIFGQKPPTNPPHPTGNSTLLNIAQTNHIPG